LWFAKRTNQTANRFLAVALAIAVLWITRILVIDIQLGAYFPHWSRLPLSFKATIFFTSSIKVFDICTLGSLEGKDSTNMNISLFCRP
jgi:hypothetical protein